MAIIQLCVDGTTALYHAPKILVPPPEASWKAFGSLYRGDVYPIVEAMSGYSQPGHLNIDLENPYWSAKAHELRQMVGLPPNKSLSSHVECQFFAYLIAKHTPVFLDRNTDLATVTPHYDIKAVIDVNKTYVCTDCRKMYHALKAFLAKRDVSFEVTIRRVLAQANEARIVDMSHI